MKWIAKVVVFSAAMFIGEFAAAFFWNGEPQRIDESPHAYHSSHPAAAPVAVRVMYAGWQSASNLGETPHLRFIVYNGLNEPVTYHGFSDFEAVPVVFVDGEYIQSSRCPFGTRDYVVQPGGAAEFHVSPDEFGRRPAADSRILGGLNLYLRNSDKPNILSTSEPFHLPEDFRLLIPSPGQTALATP